MLARPSARQGELVGAAEEEFEAVVVEAHAEPVSDQVRGHGVEGRGAVDTLARYRVNGHGPVFHRFGRRIRYLHDDLEAWAAPRRRIGTFDDGTARAERAKRGTR